MCEGTVCDSSTCWGRMHPPAPATSDHHPFEVPCLSDRRRWGLVMGRLPAKDLLTVDTMRDKVRSGVSEKSRPCPKTWGAEQGP